MEYSWLTDRLTPLLMFYIFLTCGRNFLWRPTRPAKTTQSTDLLIFAFTFSAQSIALLVVVVVLTFQLRAGGG